MPKPFIATTPKKHPLQNSTIPNTNFFKHPPAGKQKKSSPHGIKLNPTKTSKLWWFCITAETIYTLIALTKTSTIATRHHV